MIGKPDYRNPLEQQAIRRLEENVQQAHDSHRAAFIYTYCIGVSDLERLLYYIAKLEHELDYRDLMARSPGIVKGLDT